MKISKTQFENKRAKQWIDGSAIALTAKESVICNGDFQLALREDGRLVIFDITGTKAILPLNDKYLNIMKSKENYIAEIQMKLMQELMQ